MYKESQAMKEIRKIRDMNYELTKNMNSETMIEYFKNKARKTEMIIKKKVGI